MSRGASSLLAVVLLMVVSACFTVPVAAPRGLPLDAALLGRWECTSVETESADHAQLYVLRFDQQQYYAEWREGDKVDRYRAYPVRARGVTFLGVGDLGPSSLWPWSAVLYSVREGGALSLQLPAKRILDMSDEKAAIQELKAKADRPDTWQSLARCERPKNGA